MNHSSFNPHNHERSSGDSVFTSAKLPQSQSQPQLPRPTSLPPSSRRSSADALTTALFPSFATTTISESANTGKLLSPKSSPYVEKLPKQPVLCPPQNFACVEPGLFRSALPGTKNLPYIRSLRINRLIVLCPESPDRRLVTFCKEHEIKLLHTGARAWPENTSWKPISERVVKESLEIILKEDYYPILVCDVSGVHLVGMLMGCLRRLQKWNLNSAVHEYRIFAGSKTRYVNEQFIELFDVDLVTIPDNPPEWLKDPFELDELEDRHFDTLVQGKKVDQSGTVLKADDLPRYVVYYYSSTGPLNSRIGGKKARIEAHCCENDRAGDSDIDASRPRS